MAGWTHRLALIPARARAAVDAWLAEPAGGAALLGVGCDLLLPLAGYQVLHAGPVHLLGNSLFFWVFGARLESRAGSRRFLLFHVLCGVLGGVAEVLWDPQSTALVIGASGAVAGSMAGYAILYLRARVLVAVPIVVVPVFVEVPAVLLIGLWFGLQLEALRDAFGQVGESAVAHAAHAGGFAGGLGLTLPLLWRRRGGGRARRDDPAPRTGTVPRGR